VSSPPEGNQARIDELTAAGDRHSADTLDLRRDRSAGEQHPARTAALIATDPNGSPSSLRRYYPRPGSGCQRQPDLFNADSDRGQKLSPLIASSNGLFDKRGRSSMRSWYVADDECRVRQRLANAARANSHVSERLTVSSSKTGSSCIGGRDRAPGYGVGTENADGRGRRRCYARPIMLSAA